VSSQVKQIARDQQRARKKEAAGGGGGGGSSGSSSKALQVRSQAKAEAARRSMAEDDEVDEITTLVQTVWSRPPRTRMPPHEVAPRPRTPPRPLLHPPAYPAAGVLLCCARCTLRPYAPAGASAPMRSLCYLPPGVH
jgi:hypothetical protein